MFANPTVRKSEPDPDVELSAEAEASREGMLVMESRFGTIEIHSDAMLNLPNGLLGFSEFREFGLAGIPGGRHPQFLVLQCLSEPDLAFLVAPLNLESKTIDDEDIEEACITLNIPRNDLAVFLIVTVRRDQEGAHVSVNLRAPLFVDIGKNTGRQFVLPNNKYSIRHTL